MTRGGLRGWLAGVFLLAAVSVAYAELPSRPPSLPLPTKLATTYSLAQTAVMLPDGRFVVGRWDGSLQLWQLASLGGTKNTGPRILQAQAMPSGEGVQMVAVLDGGLIVSGHDGSSLALWTVREDQLSLRSLLDYDPSLGVATSAAAVPRGTEQVLVVGHESGFVTLWRRGRLSLSLVGKVDVRSSQPVPSPYPLKHIRAVVPWRDGQVITGSEDGDLVLLQLRAVEPTLSTVAAMSAVVMARSRYSATAQRGINALALRGNLLAVASCAVGQQQGNLHLLRVHPSRFEPLDEARLQADSGRAQVFAFSTLWAEPKTRPLLWVSTQEGLLWQLLLDGDKLRLVGQVPVASNVGTALVYDAEHQLLVAVGHEATVLRVP
ncbi:MAG: hypothetical protein JNM83_16720 [Myxococcales bacterium]|nr:hypothetical protein [Myxococcales bacterium]